jgi:hypothetical protein
LSFNPNFSFYGLEHFDQYIFLMCNSIPQPVTNVGFKSFYSDLYLPINKLYISRTVVFCGDSLHGLEMYRSISSRTAQVGLKVITTKAWHVNKVIGFHLNHTSDQNNDACCFDISVFRAGGTLLVLSADKSTDTCILIEGRYSPLISVHYEIFA